MFGTWYSLLNLALLVGGTAGAKAVDWAPVRGIIAGGALVMGVAAAIFVAGALPHVSRTVAAHGAATSAAASLGR